MFPAGPALQRPLERRSQEGFEQPLQRHGVAGVAGIAVDGVGPFIVPDLGPAQEDGVEQGPFGAEIIMDQGGIDPGLARHLADGDPIESVFGEQVLGRVEDGLARDSGPGGTGLGRASAACRAAGRPGGRNRNGVVGNGFGGMGPDHSPRLGRRTGPVQRRHRPGIWCGPPVRLFDRPGKPDRFRENH